MISTFGQVGIPMGLFKPAPSAQSFLTWLTKSPMDMQSDYLPAFEAYTGNRAVTQYLNRITCTTSLEQIQAVRAA